MNRYKKLTHTIYEYKYQEIFCSKYRNRIFEGEILEYTQQKLYGLCAEKEMLEILELNIQKDHIHMLISILQNIQYSQS